MSKNYFGDQCLAKIKWYIDDAESQEYEQNFPGSEFTWDDSEDREDHYKGHLIELKEFGVKPISVKANQRITVCAKRISGSGSYSGEYFIYGEYGG